MDTTTIPLRDAKAHLSELTELAATGKELEITKHGRAVARIVAPRRAREPVDLARLRALTDAQPRQRESAGRALRRLRDQARY